MNKDRLVGDTGRVVAELRDGDGVDPRAEKRKRKSPGRLGRRDYSNLRLASQIRDALGLLLAQCGNPIITSLAVGAVEPAAKGTMFVVQVYSTDPAAEYDPREVREALNAMKPGLRAAVAREVTRKAAPDFKFEVLPPCVQLK